MTFTCPHCQQVFNLNQAQQDKVNEAVARLPAGQFLKIACPQCRKPVELRTNGAPGPGEPRPSAGGLRRPPPPVKPSLVKPGPAELEWLAGSEDEEQELVEDVPLVLVLMADNPARQQIATAFMEKGYKPVFLTSAADAIQRLAFVNYAAIVLHSRYEGDQLAASIFHAHMKGLAMSKRRYIFYLLIGPEFTTLYDLEALALSANLTVNDQDVAKMGLILKKAFTDYEKLFGPLIGALEAVGRK